MTIASQVRATTVLGVRSLPRRPAASASTLIAIAMVVLVLLAFGSLGNGFRKVLQGAGSSDTAVVLREGAGTAQTSLLGADQIALLQGAPGIAAEDGRPRISPEVTVPVALDRGGGQPASNLVVRGIAPESGFMLRNVTLVSGRPPRPGSAELVVGKAAAREFPALKVGGSMRLSGADWTVVGVFAAGGSIYESEARGDLYVIRSIFKRGAAVQSVRVQLGGGGLTALRGYLARNPQGAMEARSEQDYFRDLARTSSTFIQKLGWPLALLMAVGALAGAANAMYASVDARAGEIVTLRALGFRRMAVFLGLVAESLFLATVGAAIGLAIGWLIFDGMRTSMAASALGQVSFAFDLGPAQAVQATCLAIVIGLLGALLPAFKAARLPLATGQQE